MDGFLAFLMRTHTDGYRNEILPNGLVDLFSQRRPKYLSNDVSFFFLPLRTQMVLHSHGPGEVRQC